MFTSNEKNINYQTSFTPNNNIDIQENWKNLSLTKSHEKAVFRKNINHLRIDDLSNRLKEMRNAMVKSRFT